MSTVFLRILDHEGNPVWINADHIVTIDQRNDHVVILLDRGSMVSSRISLEHVIDLLKCGGRSEETAGENLAAIVKGVADRARKVIDVEPVALPLVVVDRLVKEVEALRVDIGDARRQLTTLKAGLTKNNDDFQMAFLDAYLDSFRRMRRAIAWLWKQVPDGFVVPADVSNEGFRACQIQERASRE